MQTVGKIAGGWGLLCIITSLLVWKVAGPTVATIEAGVGLALLVVYAISRRGSTAPGIRAQASQRLGFFWVTSAIMAAAMLLLLVALNFITARRGKTVDLTNKKIHSLAPQTLQALKGLTEPVKAIGFIETKHPAYDALEQLLKRYALESDKFTYEFQNPKLSLELNRKYQIKEGQTTVILTRGIGAAEAHTSLAAVGEQDLTNAILKLSNATTQKVYFLTGHAEWPITAPEAGPAENQPSVSRLKASLEQDGYAVETLNLAAKQNEIPLDASILAIVHASTPFSQGEIDTLAQYLSQGGRLLYFADWDAESGLEPTLQKYGIQIEKGVVADALNPQRPYEAIGFPSEHEVAGILKSLEANLVVETSRGLVPVREGTVTGVITTPVLLSSPKSWIESTPENPDPSDGERLGSIPLIMASTVDAKAAPNKRYDEGRIVVFGDSGLVMDGRWGDEVLRNVVLSAFGWTSTQFQKIVIRPPDRDISVITISPKMMEQIAFLSVIGLPQLMIALGIAIRVSRRSR